MTSRTLSPQTIFNEEALIHSLKSNKINEKHAKTLLRMVIQQKQTDYRTIKDMPKKMLEILDTQFILTTSKVIKKTEAKDGSTTKLLIELQDGKRIESCIMRYGDVEFDNYPEHEKARVKEAGKFRSNKRATLCVSSQVGCAMACTFCATGTMGLVSNLTAGEIIEQLYHANKITPIRGIVFMGMGEPLDNMDAVLAAIKSFTDPSKFGLASHRISLSTVGIVPRIKQLIEKAPMISLALSLHAPTQEKRVQIVPTAKAYHIDKIMKVCDDFIGNQNERSGGKSRHILVEYVLIANINDSAETAHELGTLLKNRKILLNVIPYNPTAVEFDYKTPSREASSAFVETVREYGVKTILRQTLGDEIKSACGQLVIEQKGCDADIEDLGTREFAKERRPVKRRRGKKAGIEVKRRRFESYWSRAPILILVLVAVLIYRMSRLFYFES